MLLQGTMPATQTSAALGKMMMLKKIQVNYIATTASLYIYALLHLSLTFVIGYQLLLLLQYLSSRSCIIYVRQVSGFC